ncbi:MAG TPA: hypothetical protein VLB09_00375 [Nitrospiria bacterium]|nr:hypothetical protein [Nitrospiria bacterium]
MKIQPVSIENQYQLIELLFTYLDTLPGHPKLLEKELKTDGGSVALAIDQEGRLAVLLPSLEQDDSALVRILAARSWLRRHRDLMERLFPKKGSDFSDEIRLLLLAPSFSREMENAVEEIQPGLELHRFKALDVNRQTALFIEPVFPSKPPKKAPSKEERSPKQRVSPPETGRVTLSAEEKRFFSVAESSN